MFPRSFLFFIFIIVIDIILKSIKDKKKIEQAKSRRREKLSRQSGNMKPTVSPIESKKVNVQRPEIKRELSKEKVTPFRDERRIDIETVKKDKNLSRVYNQEVESYEDSKINQNKINRSESQFKKDILRGIIYSEILSEPKSIRNMRKSI